MEQMRKYGIPASVTLAQGILESSNGQSRLSRLNSIASKMAPLQDGLRRVASTDYTPMTSPTKSFAVMTVWVILTNTTPDFW